MSQQAAPTTEIAEYKPIEAALSGLRSKYADVAYDVTTTNGMKDAIAARRELREYRLSVENKRKELKADVLDRGRKIDGIAKELSAAISALEDPIDQQIKAEEQRKELEKAEKARLEAERVAAIHQRIDNIRALALDIAGRTSEQIREEANRVSQLELDPEEFGEFHVLALEARQSAFGSLLAQADLRKAQEEEQARIDAERAELERLRKEAEEREAEIARLKAAEEARIQAERESEAKRVAEERAKVEAELKAKRAEEEAKLKVEREEQARIQAEQQAKLEAERKTREEEERKQAEQARLQAEEQARLKAEADRLAKQKAEQEAEAKRLKEFRSKLKAAKMGSAIDALVAIWKLCESDTSNPVEVLREIAIICQANIPENEEAA